MSDISQVCLKMLKVMPQICIFYILCVTFGTPYVNGEVYRSFIQRFKSRISLGAVLSANGNIKITEAKLIEMS